MNFQVSIQRRSSLAPRGFALGIELVRQLGDLLLQALRDGRQVQLVASDHRRVGLGGKMLGKVEHRGSGHGDHVINSDIDLRLDGLVAGGSVCRRDWLVRLSAANKLVSQLRGRGRNASR